jgi:hypothetical protein
MVGGVSVLFGVSDVIELGIVVVAGIRVIIIGRGGSVGQRLEAHSFRGLVLQVDTGEV